MIANAKVIAVNLHGLNRASDVCLRHGFALHH